MDNQLERIFMGLAFVFTFATAVLSQDSFTDPRDGQIYSIIQINGVTWLRQNLNYETSGSLCLNDNSANCQEYGRLYTFEAAQNACPPGWALPSKGDIVDLARHYGGYFYEGHSEPQDSNRSVDSPQEGFKNVVSSTSPGFNLSTESSYGVSSEDQVIWPKDNPFATSNLKTGKIWTNTPHSIEKDWVWTLVVTKEEIPGDRLQISPHPTGDYLFSCRCVMK